MEVEEVVAMKSKWFRFCKAVLPTVASTLTKILLDHLEHRSTGRR